MTNKIEIKQEEIEKVSGGARYVANGRTKALQDGNEEPCDTNGQDNSFGAGPQILRTNNEQNTEIWIKPVENSFNVVNKKMSFFEKLWNSIFHINN